MTRGRLAILGSGETAPGMTKVHRALLDTLDHVDAVSLDTPYGFQENVPQMTEKLVEYFDISLRTRLEPVSFTSYAASSAVDREVVRQRLDRATYVFAGPGSPSYALAQWGPLGLTDQLTGVIERGGVVCFASAAALTLGQFTLPVYEIYKVGEEPRWLDGLGLLGRLGLPCVVLPHYDNAEGGNHDTSCCYVGQRRYRALEDLLPPGVATFGVDEHTAAIVDFESGLVSVEGRGDAHWRTADGDRVLTNGSVTPLSELVVVATTPTSVRVENPDNRAGEEPIDLARRVENRATGWESDLARLVAMAATGGEGFIDPTALVEAVLEMRVRARAAKDFAGADALRDALTESGIEIQDGPSGTTWHLKPRAQ